MDLDFVKELVMRQYRFNLAYAEKLVEDIPPALMCTQPVNGLENHPAFTLGHLVTASAMTVEDMGGLYEVPDGWSELFVRKGPGDPRKPTEGSALFPSK